MERYRQIKGKIQDRKAKKQQKIEQEVEETISKIYYKCYCDAMKDFNKSNNANGKGRFRTTKSGEQVDMVKWWAKDRFNRKMNRKIFKRILKESWGLLGIAGAGLVTYGVYNSDMKFFGVGMLLAMAVVGHSVGVVVSKESSTKVKLYTKYVDSNYNSKLMQKLADKADEKYVSKKQKAETPKVMGKI